MSDAWESMIAETKFAVEDQPRMLVMEPLEFECRKNSTSCMRILKLTDTWDVVRDARCLFWMEKRQNHVWLNSESESGELLREPWQEEPGWKHTRAESLRDSEPERGEELELSVVQEMCLRNPGKNDEQVAVRHADASGAYIIENQHEEKIMRGINVGKRGSGATSEEPLDERRKTERLER